jgi:hypothetical protein
MEPAAFAATGISAVARAIVALANIRREMSLFIALNSPAFVARESAAATASART